MPKPYLVQKTRDISFLSNAFRKSIKLLLGVYLIAFWFLYKILLYNFELNHNNYFIITTFGKLIPIYPDQ